MVKKNDVLMFKEKPLVRSGDVVYYGDLQDKYIVVLHIKSNRKFAGVEVANNVVVELQENSSSIGKGRVIKKAERDGIYTALDVGDFWLSDALEEDAKK